MLRCLIFFLLLNETAFSQGEEEARLNNAGLRFIEAEEWMEARPIFDRLVSEFPGELTYRHNRAMVLFNLKEYSLALEDYLTLSKQSPDVAEYFFQAGNAYDHLDSLTKARAWYDKAILRDKENYLYYFKRGTIQLKLKRFSDAIADYDQAIALNPDHDNSLHNRGIALYQSGRKEKACEDWCDASQLGNATAAAHLRKNCSQYPPRCK